MEADISGPQRTVKVSSVRPARTAHGTSGIAVRDGKALPFVVARGWLAPAGYYVEQWFLIDPQTREVFYESAAREHRIWGLQALTNLEDVVADEPLLRPGKYEIVFSLGGLQGGTLDVEAVEAPSEEAA